MRRSSDHGTNSLTSWELIRSERNANNLQGAWPSCDWRPMLFPGGRSWDLKIRGTIKFRHSFPISSHFLDLLTASMRKHLGNELFPPHHPLPAQILQKRHVKLKVTRAYSVAPPIQEGGNSVQPENTRPKCCQRETGYQLPPKQNE